MYIIYYCREQLDATVQNCVYTYTSDWVVVRRKYHHHSSSIRPIDDLDVCLKEPLQQQEFEIDDTPDTSPDFEHVRFIGIHFKTVLVLHEYFSFFLN